jgi:transporter family-2 protein
VGALTVLLAIVAGFAGSIQVAVMARLGDRVGVLGALAWATTLTASLAVLLLLVAKQSLGQLFDAARAPVWLWSGAVMSLLIVLAITVAGSRIGVIATVSILIAGQFAMGTAIDRFGLFGVDRIGIGWSRVAGITLLAVGAALTLRR